MLLRNQCCNIVTAKQRFPRTRRTPRRRAGPMQEGAGLGRTWSHSCWKGESLRTPGPAGALVRTLPWSASCPQDDAPMTPLCHPSRLTVLWLEVTHRAAKSKFGPAEPFHGLFLVFPGNQVYPERSPVWKLLLASPPPPSSRLPESAPSREAGHVPPPAPSAALGEAEACQRPSSWVSRGAYATL